MAAFPILKLHHNLMAFSRGYTDGRGGVLSCSEGKSFGFCRKASNLFITKFCIRRLSYAITNDSSQNVKGVCDCWGHAFSQENSSHSNHCQKVWGISGGKKSICKVFLPHSSVADLKLLNLWRNIFFWSRRNKIIDSIFECMKRNLDLVKILNKQIIILAVS